MWSAFFSVDRWHSFWGFFGDPSRGVVSITALVLSYYFILSHFNLRRFQLILEHFSFRVFCWWCGVSRAHEYPFHAGMLERYAPISLIGTVSTLATYLGLLVPLFLTAIFALWKDEAEKTRSVSGRY
jgi:hypothetical protein